jgi:Tol biopolymer transport system component/tRNA A-37 threonylcarbamoyl transferase component Bud32
MRQEQMPGLTGKTISHYRVLAKIGEGGMGVVYQAEDTKLQRQVALKVLRSESIGDPAARKRFIREARAASQLNHPNITTIYEIGDWHGRDFISMELVEGQTIKEIIKIDVLPLKAVIGYALQIAQALNEAHKKGIIHRDIKSENIMVTTGGQIKVMDFGLAKISGTATQTQGVTMGTIAYMSPEQTRGETVDFRSDIWSFGVVLYEMITGTLPFKGGYEQAVIYSILSNTPEPVEKLRPEASKALISIINRTLEKDPVNRYQSFNELLIDFKHANRDSSRTRKTVHLAYKWERQIKAAKKVGRWSVMGIALLILMFFFYSVIRKGPRPVKSPGQMHTIPFTTDVGSEINPAIAPFGNQIAYSWNGRSGNNYDIYIKAIAGDNPYQVTRHPGNDLYPAWSPDGNQIAFIRQTSDGTSLNTMDILGKRERKLADVNIDISNGDYPVSIEWSPDGTSIFYSDKESSDSSICLYSISLDGLEKCKITSPHAGVIADVCPRFSPDNNHLSFIRFNSFMASELYIQRVKDGSVKQLTFDRNYIQSADWTSDSRELVFSSKRGVQMGLWKISVDGGSSEPVIFGGQGPGSLSVSHKGDMIACQNEQWSTDIWKTRLSSRNRDRDHSEKFFISTAISGAAQYSPDGHQIAFSSSRSGDFEIWLCDSTGNNLTRLTHTDGPVTGHPGWAPDGKRICFDSRPAGNTDIYIIHIESRRIDQLTHEPSVDRRPSWSKDGNWIYFSSNRSGRFEMWKVHVATKEQEMITGNGGESGAESHDGQWLFFNKSKNTPGIWKIPTDGGRETLVLDIKTGWYKWHLVPEGIYFLRPDATARTMLAFYHFNSGEIHVIASIPYKDIWTMTLSPDQKTLLTVPWRSESDIILVEDFR